MKSSLSILALTCLFFSGWSQDSVLTRYNKKNYYTGWSQDSVSSKFNRKSYSLRDYIAPDIKFQSLDAGLLLQAGGGEGYGNGIGSFSLAYNRYVNTSDRQSQMAAGNTFFLNSNWDGKYVTNSTSNNLHLINQTKTPPSFIGRQGLSPETSVRRIIQNFTAPVNNSFTTRYGSTG